MRIAPLFWLSTCCVVAAALAYSEPPDPALYFKDASWSELSDSDGIHTFQWLKEDGGTVAFKGTTVLDVPIWVVASVVTDQTRFKEWIPRLEEFKRLEVRTPVHKFNYMHISTPFVIQDRDLIVEQHTKFNEKTRSISFITRSADHPSAPQTQYVRSKLFLSVIELTPSADLKSTDVLFFAHVDPMGTVPKWVTNLFSRGYPRQSLEELREQVHREDIRPHVGVQRYYQKDIKKFEEALAYVVPPKDTPSVSAANGG